MRVLLDLQGCQSTGSRNRGIGRYSMALAQALVRVGGGEHEFHLLLNGAFPATLAPIREAFAGLVPSDRISVFEVPPECAEVTTPPPWRTHAAESIRRYAIRAVQPDIVHVSSLFEGLGDDCATLIDPEPDAVPTAVTVYDFIPYLYADRYLASAQTRNWYMRRIESMRKAALLLGISASACDEAAQVLPERQGRIVNISSAANPAMFFTAPPAGAARRLGLTRPYVMYTGGIDWRKNIEGLVAAFAALPAALRKSHQLALVCHAEDYARTQIMAAADSAGLAPGDVVLTGFVSDEDLADLYRSCALFVFPSLHEGFGLPALEAMMCGAPVIGSNTSSIPEVIGREDALFDPRSQPSIVAHLQRALEDQPFRDSLRAHSLVQSGRFTWEQSARRALDGMEQVHRERQSLVVNAAQASTRRKLAMHAPMPPTQSGIADYTTELLHDLVRYYDVELVCDQDHVELPAALQGLPVRSVAWFRENANRYDRVVYQFGNSLYHAHMWDLLREFPGTVVLHDFFLSGALNWMETLGVVVNAFRDALVRSHGASALEFDRTHGREAAMERYPVNRFVIERANGVIVHSRFSMKAAEAWYGPGTSSGWRHIPHLRIPPPAVDRAAARSTLGLVDDEILVCSFGHIGATKLNHRLLQAWLASSLATDAKCRLVLVGKNTIPPYGDDVLRLVDKGRGRISITGYAERGLYEQYLCAADIAVQLRTMSRGETSGAVLDCLGFGVPVIANANGSNAEYPPDVLALLDDRFTDEQLVQALDRLRCDPQERARLSQAASRWVRVQHDPAAIALRYRDAIEEFAATPHNAAYWQAIDAIGALAGGTEEDLAEAAVALAATQSLPAGTAGDTPAPSLTP